MTVTIAHRGYKEVAPENTMAAFESAVKAGVDMIETDIHVCKSGEIVIMHDDEVAATSGGHPGRISEMTLDELQQLDLGAWFGSAFAGQRIPTLDQLVSFYQAHPDLKLLLEFKGEWSLKNCQKVLAKLEAADLRDRTQLESFDVNTMAALKTVAPEYDRGLLIDYPVDDPVAIPQLLELCANLEVMSLNPSVQVCHDSPELVKQCHLAGLQVAVWTADQADEFEYLTNLGVDGICTNRPGYLLGFLAANAPKDPIAAA